MATPQEKPAPMDANAPSLSGRIVEITDQDETLMIAFVPVDAPPTSITTTSSSTIETPS